MEISIDPGVNIGWALWHDTKLLTSGQSHLTTKKNTSPYTRLVKAQDLISQLFTEHHFSAAFIERPHIYTPRQYANAMITSAYFSGAIIAQLAALNIPITEVSRSANQETIKGVKIKGTSKEKAAILVRGVTGFVGPEHQTDAIFIGILAGLHHDK